MPFTAENLTDAQKDAIRASSVVGVLNQKGADAYEKAYGEAPTFGPGEQLMVVENNAPKVDGIITNHREWDYKRAIDMVCVGILKGKTADDPFVSSDELDAVVPLVRRIYRRRNTMLPVRMVTVPANLRGNIAGKITKFRPRIQPRQDSTVQIGGASARTVAPETRRLKVAANPTINNGYNVAEMVRRAGGRDLHNEYRRGNQVRVREQRHVDEDRYVQANGGPDGYMSIEEIRQLLEQLLDRPMPRVGMTWRQFFDTPTNMFYTGSTAQNPIDNEVWEFLRRMTRPGNDNNNGVELLFTPAITYPDGSRIRSRQDMRNIGFQFLSFWENPVKYNCVRMEWELQRKYDHLQLGYRKLWKRAGAGKKYKGVVGQCHVYITFSSTTQPLLRDGTLIVGDFNLTKKYDETHSIGVYRRNHPDYVARRRGSRNT